MVARTAVLVISLAIAAGLFARRAGLLTRLVRLGRPVDRGDDIGRRIARETGQVLGQRKLFQRALPGLMHAFIFWGFLVLLTTIVEAIGQAVDPDFALPLIGHSGWLGLRPGRVRGLRPGGIAIAVWIRVVQRPERFVGSPPARRVPDPRPDHLDHPHALPAERRADRDRPQPFPPEWTPISRAFSGLFTWMSDAWQRFFGWSFLWAHLLLVLGFLVYLGYSKHLHIITSAINVWFASTKPRGALKPLRIDMEKLEAGEQSLGAETMTGLTRKELLDL